MTTTTLDAPPAEESCQACGWTPAPGELWPTEGKIACRWIEDNLILAEGDWFGKPFKLRRDQKLFLFEWFEYCPDCGEWHYNEGLWGAATGDGKTAFVAAICAVSFAGPPEYRDEDGRIRGIAPASPNIPVSAASWEQADVLFGPLRTMFGGTDDEVDEAPLCGLFEVYDAEIKMRGSKPGRMFRTAAVAGTNEGGLPSLYVQDELHEWGEQDDRKGRVATVIGKSTLKRRTLRGSGRILALSTAGFDVDHSLLGSEYKRGKRRLKDWRTAPRFLFRWKEAPAGLDFEKKADREIAVRAASDAADIQWSVADRVALWGTPKYPRHEWIRYFANNWVDVADASWLREHPTAWPKCKGTWHSAPQTNPWVMTVDMALKQDSVSVGRVEMLPNGRIAFTARIWRATDGVDGKINHADVWDYIITNAVGSNFRGVAYDPRFFEVPARLAEDQGILMIEFPQSPERMIPACGLTLQLIVDTVIIHADDPDVNAQVVAAVPRWQERGGFTLSKPRSKRHIDSAITLVMGVWILHEAPDNPPATAPSGPADIPYGTNELWRPSGRLPI